jgi:hypothetical protein
MIVSSIAELVMAGHDVGRRCGDLTYSAGTSVVSRGLKL